MAATSMGEDSSLLDDEFGDFGGFEAAEPEATADTENVQPSTQAVATAWAVMAAAAPSPGLLQSELPVSPPGGPHTGGAGPAEGQHSPGTTPPTGAECGSSPGSQQTQHTQGKVDDNIGAIDWAAVGEDLDTGGGAIGFEANFGAETTHIGDTVDTWVSQALSEQHTDVTIGASDTEHDTALTDSLGLPEDVSQPAQPTTSDRAKSPEIFDLESDATQQTNHEAMCSPSQQTVEKEFGDLKDQHQLALAEKLKVQKELEDLTEQNKLHRQEMDVLQKRLNEQQQKYEDMQKIHATDLEEIRKAGHKALSLIVEEYKEICKVAVLQQQQDSQQAVKQALSDQARQYEEVIKVQEKTFKEQLETFHEELNDKIGQALKVQQEEVKLEFQKYKDEEVERTQRLLDEAAEVSHNTHKKLLGEALQEEQIKSKRVMEDNQAEWKQEIFNVRKESRQAIAEAIVEETKNCKICVNEAISEEKKQQKETVESLKSQARADMKQYIDEHRQADLKVRHRSLASIDVFLEAARQQIQLLLDPASAEQNSELLSENPKS